MYILKYFLLHSQEYQLSFMRFIFWHSLLIDVLDNENNFYRFMWIIYNGVHFESFIIFKKNIKRSVETANILYFLLHFLFICICG